MERPLRVAVVQTSPRWGAVDENRDEVEQLLAEAAPFDVAVLPELALTGYQFRSRDELRGLAEPFPGPSTEWMTALARRHSAVIVSGLAERDGGRLYNAAAACAERGLAARYRKVHLFDREKEVFDAGDLGFGVAEIEGAWGLLRLGLMICYDWRYPEAARSLAFAGAELIAHPSNLVLHLCPDAMITRAVENRVHAATANRVGTECRWPDEPHPVTFTGRSQVVDAGGHRVASLAPEETGVAIARVDLADAADKQATPRNHLWKDLRPETYRSSP